MNQLIGSTVKCSMSTFMSTALVGHSSTLLRKETPLVLLNTWTNQKLRVACTLYDDDICTRHPNLSSFFAVPSVGPSARQ